MDTAELMAGVVRWRWSAAIALLLLAACGDNVPRAGTAVVRDSAGVRIVENSAPQWQEGREWRLSGEPVVDIGGGDVDEDQLYQVRGAVRLSNGTIVVGNGSSNELRYFDASGSLVTATAGDGDGPGEFRRMTWIRRYPGDSVLGYQAFPPRLSLFGPDGGHARELAWGLVDGQFAFLTGLFSDGTILAQKAISQNTEAPRGLYRAPLHVLRGIGQRWDTIATDPGSETVYIHHPTGGGFSFGTALLGRTSTVAVHGNNMYVGSTDTYEVARYDTGGTIEMLIRRRWDPKPVRAADVEMLMDSTLRGNEGDFRRVLEIGYREYLSETMPAFGPPSYETSRRQAPAFIVDREGSLWVREYRVPPEDPTAIWSVFDRNGVLLGEVPFPPGFAPTFIGVGHVLGVWRDADDVEHVRMYQLVKP